MVGVCNVINTSTVRPQVLGTPLSGIATNGVRLTPMQFTAMGHHAGQQWGLGCYVAINMLGNMVWQWNWGNVAAVMVSPA